MAGRSAVKAPQRRTGGGKTVGPLGTTRSGDATALGGTQPHNSVAPPSMPAAGGVRVCSTAAGAGAGCDEGGWRRGLTSSRLKKRDTGGAGGGGAGGGEAAPRGRA